MACILIIDDDPSIRLLFDRLLTHAGHNVVLAEDGKAGLRLMRETLPDLIITDIMMPEMDGLEILMAIRKDFADIPVIAISGGMRNVPINFLHHAHAMGARHVFEKPMDLDVLLKAVKELLAET